MKIYIATYHNAINFGAQLQSYALQKCLSDMGYDNELIAIKSHKATVNKSVKAKIKRCMNFIYNIIIFTYFIYY